MTSDEEQELIPKPTPVLIEATRIHDAALSDGATRARNLSEVDALMLVLVVLSSLMWVCLVYYLAHTKSP